MKFPIIFVHLTISAALLLADGDKDSGYNIALCPKTPNCVSSAEPENRKHHIKPYLIVEPELRLMPVISKLVDSLPGTKVVVITDNYMRAEFRSRIFKFTDDVEFKISKDTIHIRSASRVGYSDLGVNRRRMEKIRILLQKAGVIRSG